MTPGWLCQLRPKSSEKVPGVEYRTIRRNNIDVDEDDDSTVPVAYRVSSAVLILPPLITASLRCSASTTSRHLRLNSTSSPRSDFVLAGRSQAHIEGSRQMT